MRKGVRRAAAFILPAALLALALVFYVSQPTTQIDGQGVLASDNDPQGFEQMAVDPSAWAGPWTFGLRLCLSRGIAPAVITKVAPATSVGDGFKVLGVLARDWTATATDPPIISIDAYPVRTAAQLVPAVGFAVTQSCDSVTGYPGRYTELDVGFDRVGDDGGGWKGIDVSYTVAGRPATVRFNHDLLICGSSVPGACAAGPSTNP